MDASAAARLQTFTKGNLPDSLSCLWPFLLLLLNREFFVTFESTSHAVRFSGVNPLLSVSPQERFAEIFGQDAAAESRRSQESFKKWLLVGMTVVTGVVVGSLFAQKRL